MSKSDGLKGHTDKYRQPEQGSQGATGGPWRPVAEDHRAYARTGLTKMHRGDTARNVDSVEKHQGGRASPEHRYFASPHGTHGSDGAVQVPMWSLRNPTGKTVSKPKLKKRDKTISAR